LCRLPNVPDVGVDFEGFGVKHKILEAGDAVGKGKSDVEDVLDVVQLVAHELEALEAREEHVAQDWEIVLLAKLDRLGVLGRCEPRAFAKNNHLQQQ
jgi:hypothetical protein